MCKLVNFIRQKREITKYSIYFEKKNRETLKKEEKTHCDGDINMCHIWILA